MSHTSKIPNEPRPPNDWDDPADAESSSDEPLEPPSPRLAIRVVPWAASLVVNLLLIFVLGLITIPGILTHDPLIEVVVSELVNHDEIDELLVTELSATAAVLPQGEAPSRETLTPSTSSELPVMREDISEVGTHAAGLLMDLETTKRSSSGPSASLLNMPIAVAATPRPPSEKQLGEVGDVGQAVDGIGTQIGEMLADGDLLVVWLLDASISLVDDRQRVAERLVEVYGDIERREAEAAAARQEKPHNLVSAVVAFGNGMQEVVAPTKFNARAANAVAEIPIDESGIENTFSAAAACVRKYATKRHRQILIVIWTDESGDDYLLLEPTIALCQQTRTRVCIVGPGAMLGAEQGSHAFQHPADGRVYQLPVKKGADTALAEKIRWPYWWGNGYSVWQRPEGNLMGGFDTGSTLHDVFPVSSGFGTYALTRLSLQTGGTMTVFDRPADRGPFRLADMRPYMPDYRAWDVLLEELQYYPLRRAVMQSVDVTRTVKAPHVPWSRYYYTSADSIRRGLLNDQDRTKPSANAIELALLPFGAQGMEPEYESESSPRWKAWYDLTRGRLLAQSVRYAEHRAMCLLLAKQGALPDNINCLTTGPGAPFLGGSVSVERAREAERLLRRCVENNPNTPWVALAEAELANPVGIDFRAFYQEPPPPVAVPAGPSPVPLSFPKL